MKGRHERRLFRAAVRQPARAAGRRRACRGHRRVGTHRADDRDPAARRAAARRRWRAGQAHQEGASAQLRSRPGRPRARRRHAVRSRPRGHRAGRGLAPGHRGGHGLGAGRDLRRGAVHGHQPVSGRLGAGGAPVPRRAPCGYRPSSTASWSPCWAWTTARSPGSRPGVPTPPRPATSYTPPQVAEIYQFPAGTDGTGQTIGIIELGGGYSATDLDTYFSGLGLSVPSVTAQGVDGASNVPDQAPNGADGEVLLDIEVAGSVAHGAAHRGLFRAQHRPGFHRRGDHRGPCNADARGGEHQLGPVGGLVDRPVQVRARRRVRRRRGARRNRVRGGRRRRQQRRRHRQSAARRLPCVQPARAGLRRHQPAGRSGHRGDQLGDRVERRLERRRDRRRGERRVRAADLAGQRRRAGHGVRRYRPRRARRGGQRRPQYRLPGPCRRPVDGDRRHERRRPAVGRADRPAGTGGGQDVRADPGAAVRRRCLRRRPRLDSRTSPAGATVRTPPGPAGMRAPAWAHRTAPRC